MQGREYVSGRTEESDGPQADPDSPISEEVRVGSGTSAAIPRNCCEEGTTIRIHYESQGR